VILFGFFELHLLVIFELYVLQVRSVFNTLHACDCDVTSKCCPVLIFDRYLPKPAMSSAAHAAAGAAGGIIAMTVT
jgi:hypothetical protein